MEGTPHDAVARSRGRRAVQAFGSVLLFGIPAFLLAVAVRQEFAPILTADQSAIAAATDLTRRWGLTSALIILQAIGHPTVVYAAATVVAAWVGIAKGMRGRAIWAFCTMMTAWVLSEVMKLIVQRLRPVLDAPLATAPGYSFPSGHALNITVAATVMLLLLWPLLSATSRVLAVVLAVLVVGAVGLDRIFLGVHYPSDVLAGYVLGCCITFSSWIGFVGRAGGSSSSASSGPP